MSLPAATATVTSSGIYAMPKLTEKNWVEYKTKTVMSLTARGLARHLDGTVSAPQPLPVDERSGKLLVTDKSRDATDMEIEEHLALLDAFRQKEALVLQQLYATIPNSVLIQVQHYSDVENVWSAICAIYEAKSDMMQVDIRSRLQGMKCGEKDDVRRHLTTMMTM